MDLINGNIKKIYLKYLCAALGSAMVLSIYSIVDTIAVGQFEGPIGTAALATVNPIWPLFISFGMMFGIGGGAIMSIAKGSGNKKRGNQIFTSSFIVVIVLAMILWLFFWCFETDLLKLFGADTEILQVALKYSFWLKLALPLFICSSFLSAIIRNDGVPELAAKAVIAGGIFNVVGDYVFVFPMGMGISGAGLATALGQTIQIGMLASHFFSKKCSLKFVKPEGFFFDAITSAKIGFSPFITEFCNGILICLFNFNIMKYLGSDSLAVYGIICTCGMLFQCLFYGIGQGAQPIISTNLGANKHDRIQKVFHMSLFTAMIMGVTFTVVGWLFPTQILNAFVTPTKEVAEIAPHIIQTYFLTFSLMGINIVSSYYFQAIMGYKRAMVLSLLRGIVLSGSLISTLPAVFGGDFIWFALPLSEAITFVFVAIFLILEGKKRNLVGKTE